MSDEPYDPYPWIRRDGEFRLGKLFDHPGEDLWGIASERKRVCVVGGGIAGLAAAFELRRLGHDVHVLEASQRLGGRILTDRFHGTYGELGAMRIPLSHYCVRQYVHEFQLPLRQFVMRNDATYVLLRQHTGRLRRRDLRTRFPVAETGRQELDRHISEGMSWLAPWQIFENPAADAHTRLWSRLSLWQYVQRWTVPGSAELHLGAALLSHDAWEYAGRLSGLIWDEHSALLETAVDELIFNDTAIFEIAGGMDMLVRAFAFYLRGDISLDSRVVAISGNTPTGHVAVHWVEAGRTRTADFEYVICAVPPSCALRIDWDPALPREQWEALTKISYGSAAKAVIHCDQRTWEFADGIFGGVSTTDLPIEQLWYPSDNAAASPSQTDEAPANSWDEPQLGASSALTDDLGLEYVPGATRWEARLGANLYAPGTLLAYTHGANARRFAAMAKQERREAILGSLHELHPGIATHVKKIRSVAWDNETNPGSGAFAMFNPGEHIRYGKSIAEPLVGRIFFAGEHVAGAHAWIQTSIQTALGAVWHVLQA